MSLEDREHVDLPREDAVDDAVAPDQDLAHVVPADLGDAATRERALRGATGLGAQAFHPAGAPRRDRRAEMNPAIVKRSRRARDVQRRRLIVSARASERAPTSRPPSRARRRARRVRSSSDETRLARESSRPSCTADMNCAS